MRNESLEPNWVTEPEDDEGGEGSIDCPECGKAWVMFSDSGAWVDDETTCVHIRFAAEPDATHPKEFHYFNGMTAERLTAELAEAYRGAVPGDEELDPVDLVGATLFDGQFCVDATIGGIDSRFTHTQEGIACGPISQTILFGAKLNG